MRKPRLILSASIGLTAMCVSALAVTLAWYSKNHQILNQEISGSVLEAYFDKLDSPTGDPGSQTNPFVITTPQHYENLVKLYTQKIYDPVSKQYVDFSGYDYYFEIGKKFGGSDVYQVYDVDDYGVVAPTYTDVLNLGVLGNIEPIGNDDHPFRQHLEGHNIVVRNFTVKPSAQESGEKYNDVGIFGFVNAEARVTNTYWTDFVIDTSGAEAGPHGSADIAEHEDNVRVGYLAGHIKTYESFVDCYVNNCRMASPQLSSVQRTDYSYYGLVEKDQAGGGAGGHSYSYTFDSQLWHDYFSANFSSIRNMDLCVRNHPLGEGEDIAVTGQTFGGAITAGGTGQYTVNGHHTGDDTYQGLDYSLSTAGYISGDRQVTQNTYPAKYLKDGNYVNPDVSAALTDVVPANQTTNGHYYYRNNESNEWDYYYTSNTHTTGSSDEKVYPSFHFSEHSDYTVVNMRSNRQITYSLYLDDSTTPWEEWTDTGTLGNLTIVWPEATHTVTKGIPLGTHKMALRIYKTGKPLLTSQEHRYYCAIGTRNDNNINMVDMSKDYKTHYNSSTGKWEYSLPTYEITLSNYAWTNAHWESAPTIVASSAYTPLPVNTYIIGADNFVAPMYYYVPLSSQYMQLKDGDVAYDNAYFNFIESQLYVTVSEITFIPGTEKHHFVGDEKEVAEDPEPARRYRSDCIDIVGGGIDFYYYNFFGTSLKICRVESESTLYLNRTIVKRPTSLDIGKKFFAPEYARQSIVLYVTNVGSANDKTDDNLGSMTFTYYQLDGLFQMHTCHPCFKKGTGDSAGTSNFVDFTTLFGEPSKSGLIDRYQNTTLLESAVQRGSYCCLDKDGKILGTFDRNGNTSMTPEEKSRIATYVLLIGSYTNSDTLQYRLWIQETEFSYVSKSGEGGNFGSVDYRSRPDTVITTYFNFNINELPANTVLYVDIQFTKTSAGGNFVINVHASQTFEMIFYNYFYNDGYTLTINGVAYTDRANTLTIAAETINYNNLPAPPWLT